MTRPRAWGCVAVNQLAFPGLGTIVAGRWVGYLQATIMVAGFCVFVGFMLWFFWGLAQFAADEWSERQFRAHCVRQLWALWWGLGLCALAWFWALWSSIFILRDAGRVATPFATGPSNIR